MAPTENTSHASDLVPITIFGFVIVIFFASFYYVVDSFRLLKRALPVAQRTRAHDISRRKDILLLTSLTILSLAVYLYNVTELLLDSYNGFVAQAKTTPNLDVWTSPLWFPRDGRYADLHLGAWHSSGYFVDAIINSLTNPREFWWLQQSQMGSFVWMLFVAVEGRRRNIPHLWAYYSLSSVTGMAVPVSLFFIAILLSPVPYTPQRTSRSADDPKTLLGRAFKTLHLTSPKNRSKTWTPHPLTYIIPLIAGAFSTTLLPLIDSYPNVQYLGLFCISALIMNEHTSILPYSFGTNHRTIHAAHASYKSIYRAASLLCIVVHFISTYTAVSANTPDPESPLQRRLRLFDPTSETNPDSFISRYRQGISRVLGSISDSPFVTALAWDVILTGLSLIIWTGMRCLEPRNILVALGFPGQKEEEEEEEEETVNVSRPRSSSKTSASSTSKSKSRSPTSRTSSKQKRAVQSEVQDTEDEDAGEQDATYKPSYAEKMVEHEEEHHHHERHSPTGTEEGLESAAITWGILVVGGLGTAFSGVVGAEGL